MTNKPNIEVKYPNTPFGNGEHSESTPLSESGTEPLSEVEVPNHTETEVTMSEPVNDEIEKKLRNELFDTLVCCSMRNMTIPQAKVFAVAVQFHVDLYVEKLITSQTKKAVGEVLDRLEGKQKLYINPHTERRQLYAIPLSAIQSERNKLEGK